MTEQEALGLWCPMIAGYYASREANCKGSSCMAWRWRHADECKQCGGTGDKWQRPGITSIPLNEQCPHCSGKGNVLGGYCGMAGTPL